MHKRATTNETPYMVFSQSITRFATVLLLAVSLAGGARAQGASGDSDKTDNWLTRLFQLPATGSVPAPDGGSRDWSGQSGASGHPLMTADAIRAAADDF